MKYQILNFIVAVVFFVLCGCGTSATEETPETASASQENHAAEQVNRTLSNRRRFPWYDAENGTLRFIPPYAVKNATSPSREPDIGKQSGAKKILSALIFWGTLFVLAIVGILLVWAIARVMRMRMQKRQSLPSDPGNAARRLETLLPEVRPHLDTLFADAQESWEAGRYREALIFYFSFMLVELDKAELIVLEKGKTNHDYARELRSAPNILRFYLRTMNLFERCYYGNRPLDPDEFMPIWNERESFLVELRKHAQAAQAPKLLFVSSPVGPNVPVSSVSNSMQPAEWGVQTPPESQADDLRQSGGNIARVLLPALILLSSCLGCSSYWNDRYLDYIPVHEYDRSANGDTVFRTMCKDAGHSCSMPMRAPKDFDRYDCIVWYYHSYRQYYPLKTMEVADVVWIRQWMKAKPGRSLVIVNQGYIADVDFWNEMLSVAPAEHRMWCRQKHYDALKEEFSYCLSAKELAEKLAKQLGIESQTKNESGKEAAGSADDSAEQQVRDLLSKVFFKTDKKDQTKGLWFRFENLMNVKSASMLTGLPYWTDHLPDAPPVRMTKTLIPEEGTHSELFADGLPLICHREVEQGNVYMVQSGAFLLNYPLLKERNRILASRLINRLGPKKRIVFLRGRSFVPQSQQREDDVYHVSPFALSRLSAFSLLFWHLFFLSLAVFFWKFPIFGRPKQIPPVETVDFGRHLDAYGELLERTGNVAWAREQIDKWTQDRSESATLGDHETPPPAS